MIDETRSYAAIRQEVKADLERLYGKTVILTLKEAAVVYGYKDLQTAKAQIGAKRISGQRRIAYYLGDIASDIARQRVGNVGVMRGV